MQLLRRSNNIWVDVEDMYLTRYSELGLPWLVRFRATPSSIGSLSSHMGILTSSLISLNTDRNISSLTASGVSKVLSMQEKSHFPTISCKRRYKVNDTFTLAKLPKKQFNQSTVHVLATAEVSHFGVDEVVL